jgi:hypothetical protein
VEIFDSLEVEFLRRNCVLLFYPVNADQFAVSKFLDMFSQFTLHNFVVERSLKFDQILGKVEKGDEARDVQTIALALHCIIPNFEGIGDEVKG